MSHLQILLANLIWGALPLYFYFYDRVSPLFMLAMQIIATWLVLALFVRAKPQQASQPNRSWRTYVPSACFLAANWGIYAMTVQSGQALEASFAYLITPVLFAALDCFAPANRKNPAMLGCMLATGGIIVLDAIMQGVVPIAGFLIAMAFVAYILWHRKQGLDPLVALKHETSLMLPLAIGLLFIPQDLSLTRTQMALLPLLGVLTCLPLLLFIIGSKRVAFKHLSLYQFVAPITGTLIAVELYQQAFPLEKGLIYAALIAMLCLNIYLNRPRQSDAKAQLAMAARIEAE
ncbi:EamA family transporter [Shewanella salipaludis]|uniref:EamA family transporter n=1 Tax=Shewanella salipaludis TaxID=2723052 RepID=A0A972FS73_9GAMM|nr:EamA family transporter [Shewanella salipaludis]NMH65238.1 EamA family transporter [Shewanella salipaludis]